MLVCTHLVDYQVAECGGVCLAPASEREILLGPCARSHPWSGGRFWSGIASWPWLKTEFASDRSGKDLTTPLARTRNRLEARGWKMEHGMPFKEVNFAYEVH